ncbi:hypothetical protein QYF61_002324 [Mycteria americana]|uniref:Uncharacterized protein n=1 Tax=Mycteria americana TaxID=33587 RepID=A0AAN7MVM1_MYCAM|nr:hypothetical protein QYF61_002324 [Mycteria americana]
MKPMTCPQHRPEEKSRLCHQDSSFPWPLAGDLCSETVLTTRWGSPMAFLTHLGLLAAPLLQLEVDVSEVPRALQMLSPEGTQGHL